MDAWRGEEHVLALALGQNSVGPVVVPLTMNAVRGIRPAWAIFSWLGRESASCWISPAERVEAAGDADMVFHMELVWLLLFVHPTRCRRNDQRLERYEGSSHGVVRVLFER